MMNKTAKQLLTDAGLQDSHWGKRIIEAEESGGFNYKDRSDSSEWPTCACGKQDPQIPRYPEGEPKDRLLARAGNAFTGHVKENNFLCAAQTLIDIDTRAAMVLAKVLK